ncbi:MAG: SoxR reducing system RseC family protein [Candidatus Accumulibacter phosphatis]|uniref:SoxR reducing system RseC family protein n=1 Tax=Candidatus Accumulibacter sp. ACC012 TaxID=2823332 RepID=UPI0025BA8AA5|nr:SoxR reducing system RseC family protein [Candidatus Accumulibacter sp. ACC012]
MIEHRAVVQRVEGGRAILAINLAACASCSQGGCGIGKMGGGRPTLLTLPVSGPLRAGDMVVVALPESRLSVAALIGYLFPVLAMLLGAGSAVSLDGSDAAAGLGAIAGLVVALSLGRLLIGRLPGLMPSPQLIRLVHQHRISSLSSQEFDHER